jgi:hypothetical protein
MHNPRYYDLENGARGTNVSHCAISQVGKHSRVQCTTRDTYCDMKNGARSTNVSHCALGGIWMELGEIGNRRMARV